MNATDAALLRLMDVLDHPTETLVLVWDARCAGPGPARWGASAMCRSRAGGVIVEGKGRTIALALDDLRLAVGRSR